MKSVSGDFIARSAMSPLKLVAGVVMAFAAGPAAAHFTMLLPDTPHAKKGDAVTLVYQCGHPFENQLFDAPPPARLTVLTPDGKAQELAKTLEKIKKKSAEPKEATAYRCKYTPPQRGDFTFVLTTPPIWLEETQEFVQDTAKVV